MKVKDLSSIPVWTSLEEDILLNFVKDSILLNSLTDRQKTVAENLIRKNLLARVESGELVYVCKNV
jgi:hypothetical protein